MKDVRIKKAKLVEIVTKNRAEHHDVFVAAQKTFRQKAVELLQEQLDAAKGEKSFDLKKVAELVQPSDHTHDYDRALEMLQLEENDVVTLSTADFANLVQDSWDWSRNWALSNSRYTSSPKFRSAMGRDDEY